MKHINGKRNYRRSLIMYGVCVFLMSTALTSTVATFAQNGHVLSSQNAPSITITEGDIPTWYEGDEWVYTIDPLSFSSPNATFNGAIYNCKQTVVGITDDIYTIAITGDITGDVTVPGLSGELNGDITGTSYVRVSDLAQISSDIDSQGTIQYILPIPYEMNVFTSSSPALESYDFPLLVGEDWQLGSYTTVEGSFNILGVYEQSFNESQWIDETVSCPQQEHITVPAGSFECYTIGRNTTQSWYATDVGNIVKSIVDQTGENSSVHFVLALQSYSLEDQPITITEEIVPSIVAPGASIVISGKAVFTSSGNPVQNGAVSLEIPSTSSSWSTTTDSSGSYAKTIVAPTMLDDTPCHRETGSGGVLVRCSSGGQNGYRVQTLTTVEDIAPSAPSVEGETQGKPKVSYPYAFVTTDVEADDVFYYVDWGDKTTLNWTGPYPAGQTVTITHTYAKKGSYTIKVQARDVFYAVSDWGTLDVTMPTPYASPLIQKLIHRFPFFLWVFQELLQ